ncbi:uncharacterized protein LOC119110475 [Pollicipes pollicipes]|uniref:uncharacterized protein LOC119110475 n=1 Tax=Pollicipes pollicipes TaxID=41117 RepID=UPI0018856A6E|nr:uncharacterized protein LOC119110475 [Pollicipes pollicipes]
MASTGDLGPRRPRLDDLRPHLTCVICAGYFIDATTIVECLHTFCRSCILRHLAASSYCPVCDVMIHRTKGSTSLRADRILQTMVYKLVPGLFRDEMKQRRQFYEMKPYADPELPGWAKGDVDSFVPHVYTADEDVHVRLALFTADRACGASSEESGKEPSEAVPPARYLRCAARTPLTVLQKFVRTKFQLSPVVQVQLIYGEHVLPEDISLMDLGFMYRPTQGAPVRLAYRFVRKRPAASRPPEVAGEPAAKHPRIGPAELKRPVVLLERMFDADDEEPSSPQVVEDIIASLDAEEEPGGLAQNRAARPPGDLTDYLAAHDDKVLCSSSGRCVEPSTDCDGPSAAASDAREAGVGDPSAAASDAREVGVGDPSAAASDAREAGVGDPSASASNAREPGVGDLSAAASDAREADVGDLSAAASDAREAGVGDPSASASDAREPGVGDPSASASDAREADVGDLSAAASDVREAGVGAGDDSTCSSEVGIHALSEDALTRSQEEMSLADSGRCSSASDADATDSEAAVGLSYAANSDALAEDCHHMVESNGVSVTSKEALANCERDHSACHIVSEGVNNESGSDFAGKMSRTAKVQHYEGRDETGNVSSRTIHPARSDVVAMPDNTGDDNHVKRNGEATGGLLVVSEGSSKNGRRDEQTTAHLEASGEDCEAGAEVSEHDTEAAGGTTASSVPPSNPTREPKDGCDVRRGSPQQASPSTIPEPDHSAPSGLAKKPDLARVTAGPETVPSRPSVSCSTQAAEPQGQRLTPPTKVDCSVQTVPAARVRKVSKERSVFYTDARNNSSLGHPVTSQRNSLKSLAPALAGRGPRSERDTTCRTRPPPAMVPQPLGGSALDEPDFKGRNGLPTPTECDETLPNERAPKVIPKKNPTTVLKIPYASARKYSLATSESAKISEMYPITKLMDFKMAENRPSSPNMSSGKLSNDFMQYFREIRGAPGSTTKSFDKHYKTPTGVPLDLSTHVEKTAVADSTSTLGKPSSPALKSKPRKRKPAKAQGTQTIHSIVNSLSRSHQISLTPIPSASAGTQATPSPKASAPKEHRSTPCAPMPVPFPWTPSSLAPNNLYSAPLHVNTSMASRLGYDMAMRNLLTLSHMAMAQGGVVRPPMFPMQAMFPPRPKSQDFHPIPDPSLLRQQSEARMGAASKKASPTAGTTAPQLRTPTALTSASIQHMEDLTRTLGKRPEKQRHSVTVTAVPSRQ